MNNWDRNGIIIALVWLIPAATMFWAVRSNHRGSPTPVQLGIGGGMLVLSAVFLGGGIYAAWTTPRRLHAADYAALSLWFMQVVLWGWLCRYVSAKSRMERGEPGRRARKGAGFFWQGVMILLPVGVMAAFGFWAILKEHNAVEQDAHQRANDLLHEFPGEFGRGVAFRLTQYETYRSGWFSFERFGVAAWPGDRGSNMFLQDTNERTIMSNAVATMKAAFPDWNEGPPPIMDFVLDENGALMGLSSDLPRPPAWYSGLSTNQAKAWTALVGSEYETNRPNQIGELVSAFEKTAPSAPAQACAEFIGLRAQLQNEPATNAIDRLIQFGGRHYKVESESGIPLSSLALAEALKRSRECGFSAEIWNALQDDVTQGSSIAPHLLDEAGSLATNDSHLSEGIKAMRILSENEDRERDMVDALNQSGELSFPGVMVTNFWVNALDGRWFCILKTNLLETWGTVSNRPYRTTNWVTEVWCLPKSLVTLAFNDAFDEARIRLPDYFRWSVSLEGETLPVRPGSSGVAGQKPAGEIFAEEDFKMYEPGFITAGEPGLITGGKSEVPYEAMPSHPQFSVGIVLADRNLLYARQRQLQIIFGTLIGFSVLAAFAGFIAARRAFIKQQNLSEMKSDFVSSVSHELRAPIASVRLMAEGLERGKVQEPGKQHEYFKFIVQECRRLSSLIENVLDFSRIEEGRKRYEMESTDLVALTEQTVKVMDTYAAERQVELRLQVSGQATPVNADGKALQQALVNLIDNAIKHSPKAGAIAVSLNFDDQSSLAGRVSLSVKDQGEGIAVSEHEKIFERFYRVGSELRRETQGVGIGLSIVKHIVEAHGGKVTVQSAPGQGSVFTIELPAGPNGAGGQEH